MKIKIGLKLVLFGIGCVLVTVAVMIGVGIWQIQRSSDISIHQVNELIDRETGQIALDTFNLLQSQDEAIQLQVSGGLNVMRALIENQGGLTLGTSTEEWSAINQYTKEAQTIQLPRLLYNYNWLGQVSDPATAVPAVDMLYQMLDAKATIFQPLPDGSGIIRVATNITGADGNRAIGTYIPKTNPDGSVNPVFAAVMSGEDYRGTAFVVDAWYLSAYSPVFGSKGDIIAVIFVGVKQESIPSLRNAIRQTRIGDTGYISIIGGKGDQRGKYIISPDTELDGQSVWEDTDSNGNLIYQDIVNKALELQPGELATFNFQAGNDESQRVVKVSYYEPWDWIIMVNSYRADYQSFYQELDNAKAQMLKLFLLFGIGLSGLSLIFVLFFSSTITRPIITLAETARTIGEVDLKNLNEGLVSLSQGDLNTEFSVQAEKIEIYRKDEIGLLAESYNTMITDLHRSGDAFRTTVSNLRELVGQLTENAGVLSESSQELASSANLAGELTGNIADSIQLVSRGINEQTQSVRQTAGSIEEMSHAIEGVALGAQAQSDAVIKASEITQNITNAIQQIADNAQFSSEGAARATENAQNGSKMVDETIQGMLSIKEKVGVSAEKVQEMGQRSDQIGVIVETIADIASQTNLLALNAAIEAARAGEHGKGFSVVADEVRKLAERSSLATKEIGELVNSIQQTVSEAVLAMNDGAKEVETGVELANQSGDALRGILDAIEIVNQQVKEIAVSVQQISGSSNMLETSVDSVSAVVEENTASTRQMADTSKEVKDSIETIVKIARENNSAAEAVSTNTVQMSARVEQVNDSAQALAKMAESLQQVVMRFKL